MPDTTQTLWDLTIGRPQIDADALADALLVAADSTEFDARTRLLVRDSLAALEQHWGSQRLRSWLTNTGHGEAIERVARDAPDDERGFHLLRRQLVDAVRPEKVMQLLRELAAHVHHPTRLVIGGAIALILDRQIVRHTHDIDFVDEVPAIIREQHKLLESLATRYGLRLTHLQSPFLPTDWQNRIRSIGVFDQLSVFAVDRYDVALGKLFSTRDKDRDDLRVIAPRLGKSQFAEHLRANGAALASDARLRQAAAQNWFILFGEQLPS